MIAYDSTAQSQRRVDAASVVAYGMYVVFFAFQTLQFSCPPPECASIDLIEGSVSLS